MIPEFKDYAGDSLEKLLWQYRDSTNIQALLVSIATELNSTQQDTFDIVNHFNIEDAEGELLTMVAKILGISRGGRTDEVLRGAVTLQIAFNTSQGTPDNILRALSLATNATKVKMWESFPMSAVYYTNGDTYPEGLLDSIQGASPVCCDVEMVIQDPDSNAFYGSEIDTSRDTLVTNTGDSLITSEGYGLEVNSIISVSEEPTRSMWSEYTYGEGSGTEKDTPDGLGIFCEILI